jgi:acyl carrier protein phosphodiesterase
MDDDQVIVKMFAQVVVDDTYEPEVKERVKMFAQVVVDDTYEPEVKERARRIEKAMSKMTVETFKDHHLVNDVLDVMETLMNYPSHKGRGFLALRANLHYFDAIDFTQNIKECRG